MTAKGYVTQAWVNAQKFISDLVGSITKNATAVGNALYGALKLKFDLVYSSVLGGVSEAWVNAQGFITNVVTAVTANASAVANALYASLKPKFDLLYNAGNQRGVGGKQGDNQRAEDWREHTCGDNSRGEIHENHPVREQGY